ncbi:MAG: 2Fe-2S iron-sulfur cluster binding domain-containing protein, partial [Selenomonas sp.]|nr:2Fe-2S iron-sulfur cluster binding domain-containing protein [Selenomonas sp.]
MADTVEIVFQPSGRRGRTLAGTTLLAAAQELGVGIEAVCGGKGVCGKCRVIVEEGRFEKLGIASSQGHVSALSPVGEKFFSREELERGYRLACLAQVNADLVVTVPEESRTAKQVILEQGKTRAYSLNPAVKQYSLTIEPAALDDARDDRQRLLDALAQVYGLENLTVDYTVLRDLPQVLRQQDWQVTVTVWQEQEVIRVVPGRDAAPSLGIAIDIGTTTLAAFLCDLTTGELLGRASRMN